MLLLFFVFVEEKSARGVMRECCASVLGETSFSLAVIFGARFSLFGSSIKPLNLA